MTPNRPYLLRAIYQWIVDNDLTPHILVDARLNNVMVPMGFVEDGRIVLNIAPQAVQALELANDAVSFSARFAGQPENIYVPMTAVLSVYARENGQGMIFPDWNGDDDPDGHPTPSPEKPRPTLRVVK